jgi:hypothetical protein
MNSLASSLTESQTTEHDSSLQLLNLLMSRIAVQSIYVAAELDIAELLAERPQSVAELARATDTKPDMLERLLRYLVGIGIFRDADDNYQLTPLGEKLRSGVSGSIRNLALLNGDVFWGPTGHLLETIRTGQTAFDLFHETGLFGFLQKKPEVGVMFNQAMVEVTEIMARPILNSYDFSKIRVLADIGGGNGQMLSLILSCYPEMKGILFDLPHVIENTAGFLANAGITQRVQRVEGDFFKQIQPEADAYMLKYILHDWDDSDAATILKNIRAIIPNKGRLLIMDSVVNEDNQPAHGKTADINMMILTGGRERTLKEFRSLLSKSGFELSRVYGEGLHWQILECLPV